MTKRGRKRLSETSTKRQKVRTEEEDVDKTVYEVERIVNQRTVDGDVQYYLKWKGYSKEENTWETDLRINTPELLHKFAKTILDKDYNEMIETHISKSSGQANRFFLETLNPLSIIAANFLSLGSVRYVTPKSVEAKKKMLQALMSHDHEYAMRTIIKCDEDHVRQSLERYRTELAHRTQSSIDYPTVGIIYESLSKKKDLDTVTLPPPPLANLIFECIPKKFVDHVDYRLKFARKSANLALDGAQPFIHKDYFQNFSFGNDSSTNPRYAFLRNGDFEAKINPRFFANFTLQYDNDSLGWVLCIGHDFERGRPLMQMTGLVCDQADAADSLKKECAAIALVSFIKITGTEKCLDRRQFYDFSRFIKHSCDPNCSVKLVDSGKDYPDLVVYTKEKVNAQDTLTLNYFKGFENEVDDFFNHKKLLDDDDSGRLIYLHEQKIPHMICACAAHNCKKIVQVKNEADEKFGGLKLVEDPRIYEIKNYKFVPK